jgi:CRP-like cAMP-binding protein
MTVTRDQLRVVPLFSGLNDSDLDRILTIGREVRHEAGKPVVEEQSGGVGFHLILHGEASVSAGDREVATAGPGDYFGEMSIVDGKPRSASVTATSDVTTLSITAWDFNALLDEHPALWRPLVLELCMRVRRLTEALTS